MATFKYEILDITDRSYNWIIKVDSINIHGSREGTNGIKITKMVSKNVVILSSYCPTYVDFEYFLDFFYDYMPRVGNITRRSGTINGTSYNPDRMGLTRAIKNAVFPKTNCSLKF